MVIYILKPGSKKYIIDFHYFPRARNEVFDDQAMKVNWPMVMALIKENGVITQLEQLDEPVSGLSAIRVKKKRNQHPFASSFSSRNRLARGTSASSKCSMMMGIFGCFLLRRCR